MEYTDKKKPTLEDTQTIETDMECCPDAKAGEPVTLVVKGSVREVTKDGRVLVDVEAVEPHDEYMKSEEPEEPEDEDEDEEKPMAHDKMAGEGITITIGKAPMPPRLLHAIKKKMMDL